MRKNLMAAMLLLTSPLFSWADHAADMAKSRELFTGKVRPFFKEHCVKCHGGEKIKSNFNLATRESLLKGGDQNIGAIPGDGAKSPLVLSITHEAEPHMPPKKPPVDSAMVKAVVQWIDLGAAYDKPLVEGSVTQGPMQVTAEDKKYWAFAPLKKSSMPSTTDQKWSRTPIDRFLLRTLEQNKIQPVREADRRTLIRRVYFDVIGLPPEPEEVKAFVEHPNFEVAWETLIDRLLASPHFGERWARHWLDPARFAESHGFEHDYDRKFAYHFRDFVIKAFNMDMPYDQFLRWQLAGDELAPDEPLALMATGFMGAGVYPTQITTKEAERVRYDALDDMLATTGNAMLALTIGCARCHDHKYDPIPMRDYYELLSAFTTTVRSEIDVEITPANLEKELANFEQEKKKRSQQLSRFEKTELKPRLQNWLKNASKPRVKDKPPWDVLYVDEFVSEGGADSKRLEDGSILVTGKNVAFDVYRVKAKTALPSYNRGAPGSDGRPVR